MTCLKIWLRDLAVIGFLSLAAFVPDARSQGAPVVCDADGDGDIDRLDIAAISAARGKPASGPTDPRDPDRDGRITSADARTCAKKCTLSKCASPVNRAPVAHAGADQSYFTGEVVTLDGSASSDPDGNPITYAWTFVRRPGGSTATLNGANTVSPSFTTDEDGEYEIRLIVRDGFLNSAPDTVIVTSENVAPVAVAGPDQRVVVGTEVTLDGSGSSDANGDPLTFRWVLASRPAGSAALLDDTTAVMPQFTPDVTGPYLVDLIVNDGKVDSAADRVRVDTDQLPNNRPIADADEDQSVPLGAKVTLDGSGSSDPDGDPITYAWSLLSKPVDSIAALAGANTTGPMFTADKPGDYVAQLMVSDGQLVSAPDTVKVSTTNTKPVADAGDDQIVTTGDNVDLDGNGSFDADGDPLSFQWSFTSTPAGSAAQIQPDDQPTAQFVADKDGLYVAQLIVDDGTIASAPDTARIDAASLVNRAPVANPDSATTPEDTAVNVDVLANDSDPDGDPLTLVSVSAVGNGSAVILAGKVRFTPAANFVGQVVFTYVVSDGDLESTGTITIDVTAVNDPPVARDDSANASSGIAVDIDVLSNDTDIDGDVLSIQSVTVPGNGAAVIVGGKARYTSTPGFTGVTSFEYTVSDGHGGTDIGLVTVTVAALPAVTIDNVTAAEGNSGTKNFRFTVALSQAFAANVTVEFATANQTASAGSDYVSKSGTVTFTPGQTSQFVDIVVNGDTDFEADETFRVTLSNAVNATISQPQGIGTVNNDDQDLSLSLAPVSATMLTSTTVQFTVAIDPPAGAAGVTVNLLSSDTTVATVPASVVIASGQDSAAVVVTSKNKAGSSTISASAAGFPSDSSTVTVNLRAMSVALQGSLIGIGRSTGGTVTLDDPAPAGGVTINLATGNVATATVVPGSVNIAAGATTGNFTVNGIAPGTTPVNATGAGFQQASANVTVTTNIISLGVPGTVGPGSTTELAVALSAQAPAGGVTINFSSSGPAIATVTPSVFIPAGQQTPAANPVITGVSLGTVIITATAAGFAPDSRDASVTLVASFDPATVADLRPGLDRLVVVKLSSLAPAGGITFDLTTDHANRATVAPAQVTIPQGQLSAQVTVSGVGQGATTIRATPTLAAVNTATLPVTVLPAARIRLCSMDGAVCTYGTGGTVRVGENLQAVGYFQLESAPTGPVDVTVTVANEAVALVSILETTQGSKTIVFEDVADAGQPFRYFSLQGLQQGASTTVTVSAPGYAPLTYDVAVDPSGFVVTQPAADISTNSFAASTNINLSAVRLARTTLAFGSNQEVRGGLTVPVVVTSSMPAVGAITISPVNVSATQNNSDADADAVTQFDPLTGGTATIALTQPAGFQTISNPAGTRRTSLVATVDAPQIRLCSFDGANCVNGQAGTVRVGEDLQTVGYFQLEGDPPGPVDVTISTASAAVAVVSANETIAGQQSITFDDVDGAAAFRYFSVHGLQQGQSTTVTVSALGFESLTYTVEVDPSGFVLFQPAADIVTNSFAANTTINLTAVRLARTTLAFGSNQEVRGGLIVPVTVTSSVPAVGVITVSPVNVSATQNNNDADTDATTQFDPLSGGATTIALTQPAGFQTISNPVATRRMSVQATVEAPQIRLCSFDGANCTLGTGGTLRVGEDLQTVGYFQLEGDPPNPVDVTISTGSAAVAVVSANETTAGQQSITIDDVDGAAAFRYFAIQGLQQGQSTTLTIAALGFEPLTYTIEVDPSGFALYQPSGDFTTNSFAANTNINLTAVRLVRTTLAFGSFQEVRGGLIVPVVVTSADTNVGTMTVSPVNVSATQNNNDSDTDALTQFDPQSGGTSIIALTQPAGFQTISNPVATRRLSLQATVEAPQIRLCTFEGANCTHGQAGTIRVGEDLQTVGYLQLESDPPNPVDVTISTGSAAVALVSLTETVAGQQSVVFDDVDGLNAFRYFAIHGLQQGSSTTVTISAPGYESLSYTVEVDPSAFGFYQPGSDFATTPFSAPTSLSLTALRLNRGTLTFATRQEVRGGLIVPVTVSSSLPSVGVITSSPVNVSATQNNSELDVDATTSFDALTNGVTTLTVVTPAGFDQVSNGVNNSRRTLVATSTGGLPVGQTNLSQLPGTAAVASTEFSAGYVAALAIDGVNATTSSWCTANNDPAPKLTVTFPNVATVRSFAIVTSWSPNYDFMTGRFRVLTAADVVLYDSGVVPFTAGAIGLNVPGGQQLPGAKKVEFTGVTWLSIEPCLSEFAIGGSVP